MDDALPTRPVPLVESARSTTPPVTRKRSQEEMNGKAMKTQEPDSGTIVDNTDAASTQIKQDKNEPSSLSSTLKPSGSTSSMLPPPLPASSSTSQKPPRSGQGSTASTQSSQPRDTEAKDVTDAPATTQKADNEATGDDSTDNDEASEPDSPELSEPYERIEIFDWNELQQRYHDKTSQLHSEEAGIVDEFHGLCDASLHPLRNFTLLTAS